MMPYPNNPERNSITPIMQKKTTSTVRGMCFVFWVGSAVVKTVGGYPIVYHPVQCLEWYVAGGHQQRVVGVRRG